MKMYHEKDPDNFVKSFHEEMYYVTEQDAQKAGILKENIEAVEITPYPRTPSPQDREAVKALLLLGLEENYDESTGFNYAVFYRRYGKVRVTEHQPTLEAAIERVNEIYYGTPSPQDREAVIRETLDWMIAEADENYPERVSMFYQIRHKLLKKAGIV